MKPLEVEEPIDVWVHRPLAYLLARALMPTPVSPNFVTLCSIVCGLASGAAIFLGQGSWHLPVAGALLFLSAVLDCADGQLARLRKSSSPLGRMLDGVADLIVSSVVVLGGAFLVLAKYRDPPWLLAPVGVMVLATIVTSSFHTTMYDHYKNVYLRLTHENYREGEDLGTAEQRHRMAAGTDPFWLRACWVIYLFYLRSQTQYVRGFDPFTKTRLADFPAAGPRNASIYRRYAGPLMRLWRNYLGFGSLVFGLAVSIAFNVAEYYMVVRLVLLNALFYGHMRPGQRRASELSFAEMSAAREPPVA
ncbi:MAG TPA: CDP-alcohol phosphatidyltransferase family protein [Polyangiaceae bacterium]